MSCSLAEKLSGQHAAKPSGSSRPLSVRRTHSRKNRNATAYEKGVSAERIAVETLERNGFRVLDRRYRTSSGEVDLVIAGGRGLAFVEVKRRRSAVQAVEAITTRQQARIVGAAEIWLQAHPEYADRDITFDAVLVSPDSPPQHLRDAFRPSA